MNDTPDDVAALDAANEADLEAWKNFLDLPVSLSVELGRTRLTAREILALELNDIIQLQRSTGEGVDLFTDNQRLARADVVMLEDRTGVRVSEIII